jgi:hypothetical protein
VAIDSGQMSKGDSLEGSETPGRRWYPHPMAYQKILILLYLMIYWLSGDLNNSFLSLMAILR